MPLSGYLDAGTVDRLMGVRSNCYRTPQIPSRTHLTRAAVRAPPFETLLGEPQSVALITSRMFQKHVFSKMFYLLKHRYTTLEPADHPHRSWVPGRLSQETVQDACNGETSVQAMRHCNGDPASTACISCESRA